jgi:FKBP-type peptidyl-prolyl cis-trans isomerase
MTCTLEDAEEMYTKAMDDADKGDYAAHLFVKYCDPFDFVDDDGKGKAKIDYAKAHRVDMAEKKERKKQKKKTRARNRQRAAKAKKEEREKKRTDLQLKAIENSKEKKAKRAEKVDLETCPARKELRRLKHPRVRSFSVD